MLTAARIIPHCNLHQLHEKHSATRREAASRAKWGAVNASPASSQLLNWFLSVTSERVMGSHTARLWKSETYNTTLQQNSKTAPKSAQWRVWKPFQEKGWHTQLQCKWHRRFYQHCCVPSYTSAASSQPPLLLPGQHCCQGLGRAQELLHRLLCQAAAASAFNIIMNKGLISTRWRKLYWNVAWIQSITN